MKIPYFLVFVVLLSMFSCNGNNTSVDVRVANPLGVDRTGEIIELPLAQVAASLGMDEPFVIQDAQGVEVPYQLTHDKKIIWPVTVKAHGETVYRIKKGVPSAVDVKVCGKVYPERMDDLAWENDLVGFRAYGPALQALGERGFGYDLFTKRGTTLPVLEKMYAMETDKETWAKINELKKTDPAKAEELRLTITYHVDRGYGMDCYAVGPTLGGGVAALSINDSIVYPWCYKDYEILDNGPLRFTAKLKFTPLVVGDKNEVIETRIITLDLGSHLNRTEVSYTQLDKPMDIVAGFVMHNIEGPVLAEASKGYITYVDPTTGPNQGQIFVGAAFPNEVKEAGPKLFSAEEKKQRNNATGHVLAKSDYDPNKGFTYYWGFAWDRADIQTIGEWNAYMADFAMKIRNPLSVSIK